jgi:mannobiose 2-epimerase
MVRTAMEVTERLGALAAAMERNLRTNVLPFWVARAPDRRRGGFVGWIGDDLAVDEAAPRGGVLNSRILWAFSAASRRYPDPAYCEMAERAYAALCERFWDETHGGVYWMLDAEGRPLEDRKQTYNLAFAVYGLAEYAGATGSAEARERAAALFRTIEEHAFDPEHGGYWEARARDWRPLDDVRLSEKDENAPKSMNTHLHVMEAYAALLRVWPDPGLRERLRELVRLHVERIVDPASAHLLLFFDESWRPLDRAVSFGHDIEASWLLVEAAEAVGDEGLMGRVRAASELLARTSLSEGLDPAHGGLLAERSAGGHLDDDKHWWMQAEAVVGFLGAFEQTRSTAFLDAAESVWRFVERFVVDAALGEWRWRVARDGRPIPGLPKVEPWKGPYHNSRAALEVLARAGRWSAASGEAGDRSPARSS